MPRLTTHDAELYLDGQPWMMRAGELQYFRLPRKGWERSLGRMRALGFNAVTTYIPWIWHEPQLDHYDFAGATDRRRDLAGFLRAAHAEGLVVVARPGPYINAEYAGFGYPRWLAAQIPQARMLGPDGTPVGGTYWDAFALGHPAYRAAVQGWYEAVVLALGEFWDRPVVAWQLDNETGYLQQNGLGRWDWNPTTVARFHTWLARTYGDVPALNAAWGARRPRFDAITPPRPSFQQGVVNDWQHFLEDEVTDYLAWLAVTARAVGVPVPLSHNEAGFFQSPAAPAAKARTPGLDLYGYDLYLKMSGTPVPADFPWAACTVPALFRAFTPPTQPLLCWELGTGWFDPRSQTDDTVLVQNVAGGLAHGLGGFSLYIVQDGVEADGHPYTYRTIWDHDGQPGPRHAIAARLLGVGGWGLGVGADQGSGVRGQGSGAIKNTQTQSSVLSPQSSSPTPNPQPPTPTVGVAFYGPDARFAADDFLPGLTLQEPARIFAGVLGPRGVVGAMMAAGYGPNLTWLDLERATGEALAACRVLILISRGRLDPATYDRLQGYVAGGGHLITCGRTPRRTLQGQPLDTRALYPFAPTGEQIPNRLSSILHLARTWGIEYQRERAALIAQHPTSQHLLDAFEPLRALLYAPQAGLGLTGRGRGRLRGDYVLETYRADSGVLLWHGQDPAAYVTRLGAGTSTMIGTLVGGAYATPAYYTMRPAEREGIRNFWRGLLGERGIAPVVRPHPGLEVAVQVRPTAAGALLVVINPRAERQQGRFTLTGPVGTCTVLFSGADSDLRWQGDQFAVDLAPGDAVVAALQR